ncbi:MAG: hypothetical protein U0X41_01335 [Chitinophagales bacterium]
MVELLQQLLRKHNCVIIPNFGAFIGNYHPSEIRLTENRILPPNKTIAFNRSLQNNDGLLMNAASHHFSVSYHEAEIMVSEFSKQCNETLRDNRSLMFKGIGRLLADQENNIQFHPHLSGNYLPDSYGLPVMPLQPIQRLKDTESVIKETYQRILHPELLQDTVSSGRPSSKSAYWMTAVLAIIFLASSLTWNIHKGNSHQSQSSLMPSYQEVTVQVSNTPAVETVTSSVSPPQPEKNTVQPSVEIAAIATPEAEKAYIVIGAFFDETRAAKLKEEAERKGYVVNISKDAGNGVLRATVQVNASDVENALQKVKSEINQRAWVYCVNCSL